jgi:hypothetical protein
MNGGSTEFGIYIEGTPKWHNWSADLTRDTQSYASVLVSRPAGPMLAIKRHVQ